MKLKPISKKQILKNFAFNYGKQFSSALAAEKTELKPKVVDNYLRALVKDQSLTRTRIKGIYYYKIKRKPRNKAGPASWDFTPKRDKLERIYDLISEPKTLDELIFITSMGKRTTQRYLRVLQMLFLANLICGNYIQLPGEIPQLQSFKAIKIQYKKERITRLKAEIEEYKWCRSL